jgi:hypothetical protein
MENFPSEPGPNSAAVREQVATPAILLMVTGVLVVIAQLFSLVTRLTQGGGVPPQFYEEEALAPLRGFVEASAGPVGIFFALLSVALGGLIFFGGMKMKNLENHGLAMAAAIIAIIPCFSGCCCIIGLPAGIWSLVLLFKPEVKAAFR